MSVTPTEPTFEATPTDPALRTLLRHSLLCGRWFPLLPPSLLDAAAKQMNHVDIDQELLNLDRQLSGYWTSFTAVCNGRPVCYGLLRPPSIAPSERELMELGGWAAETTEERLKLQLDELSPRINRVQRHRAAFAGWLMCNPQYVAEERSLWSEWKTLIYSTGLPVSLPGYASTLVVSPRSSSDVSRAESPVITAAGPRRRIHSKQSGPVATGSLVAIQPTQDKVPNDKIIRKLIDAVVAFTRRWVLGQWQGPGMPEPMGIHMLCDPTRLRPGTLDQNAILYLSIPMTLPLPAEDGLRDMMEQARSATPAPSHLAEWLKLIANASTAKHALDRYARLLKLQHCWSILHERYAVACQRRVAHLERVFANHFEVSPETVHADLQFLRDHLGNLWIPES